MFWPEIVWSSGLLERKINNKVESFMFTLTWITEKELERVFKTKETNFVEEKYETFTAAVP